MNNCLFILVDTNNRNLSVCTHKPIMATKSLTVKESAYEVLKSRKREGESFSDLIERIAGNRPLTELTGLASEKEAEKLEEEVEKVRKEQHREINETVEDL